MNGVNNCLANSSLYLFSKRESYLLVYLLCKNNVDATLSIIYSWVRETVFASEIYGAFKAARFSPILTANNLLLRYVIVED